MRRTLVIVMFCVGSCITFAGDAELPAGARPGECYARVFVPLTYTTSTEQVLRQQATERATDRPLSELSTAL